MFSQLGLSAATCASLERLGYHTPTPIQTQGIPLVLSGVDLLARAQTGTGKTAAFGLPIIERLLSDARADRRAPRALVLVPTRELAIQVHQALSTYAATTPLRMCTIFGGVSMSGQLQALRRGCDIVVATPGRLLDHMQRRTVDLSAVQVLTLDEADRMLDMGFLPALRRILSALPRRRQTLLFSATIPDEIVRLSADFTHQPSRVDVSPKQVVAAKVIHQVHDVGSEPKRGVLARVLTHHGTDQALVFCKTKRGANRVGDDLEQSGITAGVIHGNKSQNARNRALDDFKAGRVRVLVATDIAARGLDIPLLPLVVNFDLPLVAEDYVHRVGRTGRAGQAGRAVSLVSAGEAGLLQEIQRVAGAPLERVAIPGIAEAVRPQRAGKAEPARQAHGPAASRHAPQGHRPPRNGARRRPAGHTGTTGHVGHAGHAGHAGQARTRRSAPAGRHR